jgi:hypothetical protein
MTLSWTATWICTDARDKINPLQICKSILKHPSLKVGFLCNSQNPRGCKKGVCMCWMHHGHQMLALSISTAMQISYIEDWKVTWQQLYLLRNKWFSKLPRGMNSYTSSRWSSSEQYPINFTRFGWWSWPRKFTSAWNHEYPRKNSHEYNKFSILVTRGNQNQAEKKFLPSQRKTLDRD